MNIDPKILGFVFVLLLLHVGLFALHFARSPHDPFDKTTNTAVIAAYAALPVRGHVQAKYHHAINRRPYTVGLFGNSRIIMVGHQDLGMQAGEVFNFAVGGTSFLQSVSLLEELAKAGKAPDISIISLDHHQIQFFGYPYWPEPILNIANITEDARLFYARPDEGRNHSINTLKILKNSIGYSWAQAQELWNFDVARRYFNFMAVSAASAETRTNKHKYLPDGSNRAQPILTQKKIEFAIERTLSPMSNSYLENTIIRLGRLVRKYGLNVIVYESPIEPENARRLLSEAPLHSQATQKRTQSMCTIEGLDCRPAPVFSVAKGGPYWGDCCHAPPSQLGNYVRTLINDARKAKPHVVQ